MLFQAFHFWALVVVDLLDHQSKKRKMGKKKLE